MCVWERGKWLTIFFCFCFSYTLIVKIYLVIKKIDVFVTMKIKPGRIDFNLKLQSFFLFLLNIFLSCHSNSLSQILSIRFIHLLNSLIWQRHYSQCGFFSNCLDSTKVNFFRFSWFQSSYMVQWILSFYHLRKVKEKMKIHLVKINILFWK